MLQLQALNTDELEFIERRYRTESKIYMRTMNVMLILGTISPMIFCIGVLFFTPEDDVSINKLYRIYFIGLLAMLIFVGLIAYVSYREKLLDYQKDKKQKLKVLETTNIVQRKYMKLNNTYHFYLSTPNKYTIEVSPADFEKYQLGDEISIEYSQHAKEYFGYY